MQPKTKKILLIAVPAIIFMISQFTGFDLQSLICDPAPQAVSTSTVSR